MHPYGKTYGPFKRDPITHKIMSGNWTNPEFDYLKGNRWHFTEKLDGTSMRIIFDEGNPRLAGRKETSDIPGGMLRWYEDWENSRGCHDEAWSSLLASTFCIYGEGCGDGIQRRPQYGEQHFRAFAIKTSEGWGSPCFLNKVCGQLGIPTVPHVLTGTLADGLYRVRQGLRSFVGDEKHYSFAEGLVGVPDLPLFDRHGSRIVVKIKHRDFYGEPQACPTTM